MTRMRISHILWACLAFTLTASAARALIQKYPPLYDARTFTWTCPTVVAVGTSSTYSVSGNDTDNYADPDPTTQDGVHCNWTFASGSPASATTKANDYSTYTQGSVDCSWSQAGTYNCSADVVDEYRFNNHNVAAYDYPHFTSGQKDMHEKDFQVIVVEADSISSDDVGAVNTDMVFSGETNEAGHYDLLTWTGGGTPSNGSGRYFTTKWSEPGSHTVTLHCGTSTVTKTINLIGGPITGPADASLYVWYPADQNVNHRRTFSHAINQPTNPGPSYTWQIVQGADKAHIVGNANQDQVVLQPDAASTPPGGDVTLRLTYTLGTCQTTADFVLSVRKPDADPTRSSWQLRVPPPRNMLLFTDPYTYASGETNIYTVKDQLDDFMRLTAYWTEHLVRLEGNGPMPNPTIDGQSDSGGQSLDYHLVVTPTQVAWEMPTQSVSWIRIDQRVTWNGWGASGGADPSTGLPAFWRFRIGHWLGRDDFWFECTYTTLEAW